MRSRVKASIAVALLFLALAGGSFISGSLVLLLLGLNHAPQTWHTYWDYCRVLDLPRLAPYAAKIRLSGYLGFGLPLAVWLALVVPLYKSNVTLHETDEEEGEDVLSITRIRELEEENQRLKKMYAESQMRLQTLHEAMTHVIRPSQHQGMAG